MKPASALSFCGKGQQIQCESGADGYSPDGRELTVSAYLCGVAQYCSAYLNELIAILAICLFIISRTPKTALILVTS